MYKSYLEIEFDRTYCVGEQLVQMGAQIHLNTLNVTNLLDTCKIIKKYEPCALRLSVHHPVKSDWSKEVKTNKKAYPM